MTENDLPPRGVLLEKQAKQLLQAKHDDFVRWMAESKRFVQSYRGSKCSLEHLPLLGLGMHRHGQLCEITGLVEGFSDKRDVQIPMQAQSVKARFCMETLDLLAKLIEHTYDGNYLLGSDSATNTPNMFIFRVLANGDFGVCHWVLTLEDNLLVVETRYGGYYRNAKLCSEKGEWKYDKDEMLATLPTQPYEHRLSEQKKGDLPQLLALTIIGLFVWWLIQARKLSKQKFSDCVTRRLNRPTPAFNWHSDHAALMAGSPDHKRLLSTLTNLEDRAKEVSCEHYRQNA